MPRGPAVAVALLPCAGERQEVEEEKLAALSRAGSVSPQAATGSWAGLGQGALYLLLSPPL